MSKLLVIDTETGGIDAETDSILTLAAVVWDDGKLGASIEIKIAEDPMYVTERAMKINRIDLAVHQRIALPPRLALAQLDQFLKENFIDETVSGGIVLAGHNINFDIRFLRRLFSICGAKFDDRFSHRSLDTASVLRFLSLADLLPKTVLGSDEAFKWFDVMPLTSERHTAIGDARSTALMLSRLVRLIGNKSA